MKMHDYDAPSWLHFLGKWGNEKRGHPLIYHMIDSAAVAQVLWQQALSEGARQQFMEWLNLPAVECERILMFWTSLHDLGKATNTFQAKTPVKQDLISLGYQFTDLPSGDIRHHSLLSQVILCDLQEDLGINPRHMFNQFRYAIGGHHGSFHFHDDLSPVTSLVLKKNLGGNEWIQAQRGLFFTLKELFVPPALQPLQLSQADKNAFFNLLTGFFVVSDWLASQDDPFKYHFDLISPSAYLQEISDRQLAFHAVQSAGWLGWQPDGSTPSFSEIFSPYEPLSLQQMIIDKVSSLSNPFLLIVEAPTGCGKTEAALLAADRAIQNGQFKGCYVAMPTQATSDQMFGRVGDFLKKRYPHQQINIQLVHGNAILNKDFQMIRPSSIHEEDNAGKSDEGGLNAAEWFLPRKRSLLAAFGIGTVDQTFYSILRTRYSILRLFGLYKKVVIFDEVHAYDTYMMKIFTQLLGWLRAIGSSVIILSATLPEKSRLELLRSFYRDAVVETATVAYPRMSLNDCHSISTHSLGEYKDRGIHISAIARDPNLWIASLKGKLEGGGSLAIICNTVERSQDVYAVIKEKKLVNDEDLFLLHARMPFCWRKKREEDIKERFGKSTTKAAYPRRGIVVATQIIEQSLDLDFDFLITDLAPIDLMIQRIGRLHRHTNSKFPPIRPVELDEPQCWICEPDEPQKDDLPVFEKDRWVYDDVILQRTYFILKGRNELVLPAESDELINQVYSDKALSNCSEEINDKIKTLYTKMKFEQNKSSYKAFNRLIGNVDDSDALGVRVNYLSEDDAQVAEDIQALTRDDVLPSVQLLCANGKNGSVYMLDGDTLLDVNEPIEADLLESAQRSMVNISKREVVQFFRQQPLNSAWKRQSILCRTHLAVFFDGQIALDNGKILILDLDLGLVVQ